MKEFNLEKTVKSLLTAVQNHIGSNNLDAHLPATTRTNGFMSSDHVNQLNQALGQRKLLYKPNVLELPPGFYEVDSPQNGPIEAAGFFEIDVTTQSTRKQIKVMQSFSGRIWIYNEHTNNVPVVGWREIEQKVEIFNADDIGLTATPVGTTFEIKAPFQIWNFRRFEFDVQFSTNNLTIGTDYIFKDKTAELQNINIENTGLRIYASEIVIKRMSDTSFYCDRNVVREFYVNGSDSETINAENKIKLNRIRGIL